MEMTCRGLFSLLVRIISSVYLLPISSDFKDQLCVQGGNFSFAVLSTTSSNLFTQK
jgi:hypothetical protein